MIDVLWKEARVASADGITFSGKHTEGAPTQRRNRRHEVLIHFGLAQSAKERRRA
jgi:hypothetical protein